MRPEDFDATHFGVSFDFIVAQSIFSHAGPDLIAKALTGFKACLTETGLVLATFVQPHQMGQDAESYQNGWLYPGCYGYNNATTQRMIAEAGLFGRPLPWYHPRQTWFAMALSEANLPGPEDDVHLSGVTLRVGPL